MGWDPPPMPVRYVARCAICDQPPFRRYLDESFCRPHLLARFEIDREVPPPFLNPASFTVLSELWNANVQPTRPDPTIVALR